MAAPLGISRGPAGMSQASFPARQKRPAPGEQSDSERRRARGGREGWREQLRLAGACRDDTQPAAWPHFPPGLLGASPIASPAASALLQPPQRTPPLASPPKEGQSATNCIPTQGGHFSSSRYGNGPPELTRTWYPGESHGRSGCGMLCLLWHHLQPRLQRWRTSSPPG